jgi:acetoin utilization deacetylase AcuC-like enzyme
MRYEVLVWKVFDSRQLEHTPSLELHNGGWVPHVDRPERARTVVERLGPFAAARDFGRGPIERVHASDYLDFLAGAHARWLAAGHTGDAIGYTWPVVGRRPVALDRIDALLGRYSFDAATPIAAGTWAAAYWAAQSALTALAPLLDGTERASFALCRPPGHHAGVDYLGGYCYLNNAAIAARAALDAGRARVAVLDIDYHHGNGTQDIFYDDPDVLFVSIHGDPVTEYPFYWGHADERGAGAGTGLTLNLPLPRGTTLAPYLAAVDRAIAAIADFAPIVLIVSFGADTYEGDPISHFALATGDYPRIAERIASLGLPTLVVMEGGYAIEALGDNVAAFLSGF